MPCWTLRWLAQNEVTELEASVMKEGLVRTETLPLVFRVAGTDSLPRGSRVRVRITGMDLLTLELHATLSARLDVAAAVNDAAEEDDAEAVGALQLAIDLGDGEAAAAQASATETP